MFVKQYIVNKAPPLVSYDLFDVRHYQRESLKDFLNRFGAQIVRLPGKDEEIFLMPSKRACCLGLLVSRLSGVTPPRSLKFGDVSWLTSTLRAKSPRKGEMWPQLSHTLKQGSSCRG